MAPTPPQTDPPIRSAPFPVTVLPQQRLLLQLVAMSGDIAITNVAEQSILWRTLRECVERGWVDAKRISPGVHKVTLRPEGRRIARAEETGRSEVP
jgi:hypothetical protein